MKTIGIIFAMQQELALFSQNFKNLQTKEIGGLNFHCGNYNNKTIIATVCGMGKVNAATGTNALIHNFSPDLIVNIGISGGLDSSLEIGDVIVGDSMVYHDVWCGEPNQHGQVQGLPAIFLPDQTLVAKFTNYKHGQLCCGDQFISLLTELQKIKNNFPQAVAVDMESAAIAQVCYLYQTPFLCVRQISDTPGVEHHVKQYEAFWENAPQNSLKVLEDILEKVA